jgi:hypothetical protein
MPIVYSIERKHATIISVLHDFVTDISQCQMWIEGYNSQQNLHRIEETDARKCNPPLLLLLYYAPGALPLWDQSKLLQHPPEVSSVSPLLCKKLIINWSRKIKLLGHKWELWLCGAGLCLWRKHTGICCLLFALTPRSMLTGMVYLKLVFTLKWSCCQVQVHQPYLDQLVHHGSLQVFASHLL